MADRADDHLQAGGAALETVRRQLHEGRELSGVDGYPQGIERQVGRIVSLRLAQRRARATERGVIAFW